MFKPAIFSVKFKQNIQNNLMRLLSEKIDFTIFNEESDEITKRFLFNKVFSPDDKDYKSVTVSEIVNGNIISKKLN